MSGTFRLLGEPLDIRSFHFILIVVLCLRAPFVSQRQIFMLHNEVQDECFFRLLFHSDHISLFLDFFLSPTRFLSISLYPLKKKQPTHSTTKK